MAQTLSLVFNQVDQSQPCSSENLNLALVYGTFVGAVTSDTRDEQFTLRHFYFQSTVPIKKMKIKKIESRKDTILTSIKIHDLIVTHVGKMLLYNTFGNSLYLVSILGIYQ